MNTSSARRPRGGASSTMSRVALDVGAHRAERVEVRVQAPAADHVAARRRHDGPAEAREQRSGEQERGADQLGELALDLDSRARRRRTARPRWRRASRRVDADPARMSSIASTSRMRGTLRTMTSSSVRRQDARIGSAPFLLPAGDHRAGQRHAAFDDELLHELERAAVGAGRGFGIALGKRNSHLHGQVRAAGPRTCLLGRGVHGRCHDDGDLQYSCSADTPVKRLCNAGFPRLGLRRTYVRVLPSAGPPSLRTDVPINARTPSSRSARSAPCA